LNKAWKAPRGEKDTETAKARCLLTAVDTRTQREPGEIQGLGQVGGKKVTTLWGKKDGESRRATEMRCKKEATYMPRKRLAMAGSEARKERLWGGKRESLIQEKKARGM